MSKRVTIQKPDGTDLFDVTAQAIPVIVIPGEGGGVGDSVIVSNIPHVIVDSMPDGGSGLTDAELRAAAVPVSGTFFQATQPVSGTFWQTTQPVSIAATVPVSGTFWQATQPVSGSVSVSNLPATQPVSGTVTVGNASLAVTGTFWQATQPVSIAATVAVSGPLTDTQLRATALPVSGTFWQATQPVSIASLPALAAGTANIGDVDVLTLPALPTGANTIGAVQCKNLPNRIRVVYKFHAVAPATADTLLSLTRHMEGQADSTTTSFGVTSGKRLRIQTWKVGVKANAAAAAWATATLRINTAGAAVIGSPSYARLDVGLTAAAANATVTPAVMDFGDDGLELSGTEQFGVSLAAQAVTNIMSVEIVGYEYTP